MWDDNWERLSEGTTETCNVCEFGWSDLAKNGPCGKRAFWIKRDTCGCWAVHMVLRHCQEHQDSYLVKRERTKEWGKRNVVTEILPGGIVYARLRNDQKDN